MHGSFRISSSAVVIVALSAPLLAERVSPEPGPGDEAAGALAASSFAWADYDGDGLLDAYVSAADGRGHLLWNAGEIR